MQAALSKFQTILKEKNLDGFIVTNPYSILYLTGFHGISVTEREAILTVAQNSATLITARLYQQEAKKVESKNLKVKIAAERNEIDHFLKDSLKNAKRIGFEENDLKYAEYTKYKKLLTKPNVILEPLTPVILSEAKNLKIDPSVASLLQDDKMGKVKLIPTKKLIENLRIIKSADEIKLIEHAQLITQKAFAQILKTLKVGQTELEIAHTLKSIIHSLGSENLAFESIVASGPNSGIPHHVSGKRQLTTGDTLLFDFGAKFQNYCADFSRTIFIGPASDRQKNIFNHVLTAQKKALATIRHDVSHHKPFHAANNHFKKNKLDEYFTHGLGHGIGLEIHEAPYLRNQKPATSNQLLEGMVFSVEPGLYFNWGGVRIEDLVTINNGKTRVLGKLTETLIEIKTSR